MAVVIALSILLLLIIVSFLASILHHLYKSSQRRDILHESYPFANTITSFLHMHTILDWMFEQENTLLSPGQDTYCINLYGLPWLISTRNIENITFILKEVETFGKGPNWIQRFSGLLGEGIFNSDGEVWYKHRKLSANLFKMSSFKNEMIDTFYDHCCELVEVINDLPVNSKFDIQVTTPSLPPSISLT
jgi:hypothetical protein